MAKSVNPPTKKELLAKAITEGVDSIEQTTERTFLPNRTVGIGTSIPAKYNPKTGKVVLMDVIQHSKECAELIKKGVVPLLAGYIYVDKNGYDTLKDKGLLNKTGDWEADKKVFKTVASAPNAMLGFTNAVEAGKLNTKRNDTEFATELKRNKTYYKSIPLLWTSVEKVVFEEKEDNLVYEALLNYVQNTSFKTRNPVTIFLYFTSNPILNKFTPYPDSKLFTIVVKSSDKDVNINITNLTIVAVNTYDSKEYEALSVVSRDIFDKQGAGHLTAVKTAEAEILLEKAKELYIDPKFIADNSDNGIMDTLKIYIKLLEEDIRELKDVDRVFGSTAAYFHKDLSTNYANIAAGANQLGLGIYFNIVNKKGVLKNIKAPAFVEMLCQIDGISTPESELINSQFKGKKTQAIVNRIYKAWRRAAAILAERVVNKEAEDEIENQSSHSLLQAALIKILADIFGTNADNKINLTKRKQSFIKLKNTYKKLKNGKIPVFKAKSISTSRVIKKSTRNKLYTSARQTTQNILPILNAEILRYVLAEMNENTLRNRTGTFARSVRILSAQENAAVQYTYEKRPYKEVFSPGNSYLATPNRDPAEIIDKAIKKIGMDRFQRVLRTEEV